MAKIETFASLDPATGIEVGRYPNTSSLEVFKIVTKAKSAANSWEALGFVKRKKILLKWAALLTNEIDVGASLITAETGKPISDARLEFTLAISHIAWAAKNAGRILATQSRPAGILMFNMSAKVERLPYGVVGVIGPWNYPAFTPMGSIAYALAAGNAVVFKPSEYTPGVGSWLSETFKRVAPFDSIFTTITGLPETGKALTESAVDKISFTGSTKTAKIVGQICAARMIPVVLECGGKDPVIIDRDADLALAAENTLWSAMSNAGQSCIGAERVYVHSEIADKFIEIITTMAKQLKTGVTEGDSYGPATRPAQLKVISAHIKDAADQGATFILGSPSSVHERYVDPVIMCDVPENSTAVTDETFGPTLVINRVENMSVAIQLANATRYGLGASVWSKRSGEKIASQLQCGMVSINSVFLFAAIASVPFGGIKDSGIGRIHGAEGLLEFAYARTIVRPIFKIPIVFTTFKRSEFADKFIMKLVKVLHGQRKI